MPLAAAGAMPLTLYTAQVVTVAVLGQDSVLAPTSNRPLIAVLAGSLTFAVLWRSTLGRGPLERLLAAISRSAALAPSPGRG